MPIPVLRTVPVEPGTAPEPPACFADTGYLKKLVKRVVGHTSRTCPAETLYSKTSFIRNSLLTDALTGSNIVKFEAANHLRQCLHDRGRLTLTV